MPFDNYPWTNLNDINLDWIIRKIKNLEDWFNNLSEKIQNLRPVGPQDKKLSFNSLNYLGGFADAKIPQALCKVGNLFYTITPNYSDDTGTLRVFDTNQNKEIVADRKTITCGHANALAYNPDNNSFYIAPVHHYDDTVWSKLIKYDATFTSYTEIDVPGPVESCNYDAENGVFYIIRYYDATTKIIEKIENDTAVPVSTVILPADGPNYEQSGLVYNGQFFLISAARKWCSGPLEDGYSYPDNFGILPFWDDLNRLYLGEIEQVIIENGRFYALNYAANELAFGFITEVVNADKTPLNVRTASLSGGWTAATLLGIDDPKFHLNINEIRSVNQLDIINYNFANIEIYGNVTDDLMKIEQNLTIKLTAGAKLTAKGLINYGQHLTISPKAAGTEIVFNGTRPVFDLYGGTIEFIGQYALTFTGTSDLMCNFGYQAPIGYFRLKPLNGFSANDLLWGSTAIPANTTFIGNNKVAYN